MTALSKEGEDVKTYMKTLGRMESEIAFVDRDATLTSIAISMKRIADSLEKIINLELEIYNDGK